MDLKTENKKKETPQSWSLGQIELRLLPWLFYYFIICAAAFTADSADFLIPKITIHKPNPLREPELVKTHPKPTPVLLCLFLLAQHPPDAGPASAAFIPPQLPQQSVPGEFRGLFKDKPRGFGAFPASEDSLFTAIHSLRSSPSGSITACRRLPLPSVASACLRSSYWWDPSGMFFFGLNVLEDRLPLAREKAS